MKSKNKLKRGGETLNGFDRRAGIPNRCYKCGAEYHLAPKCPLEDAPGGSLRLIPRPSAGFLNPHCRQSQRDCQLVYRMKGRP